MDDVNSSDIRIGDADRDAAVERLREHYAAGRLDTAEFNERMDKAMQAQRLGQLQALFTDLPADPHAQFFDQRSQGSAYQPATGLRGPVRTATPARKTTAAALSTIGLALAAGFLFMVLFSGMARMMIYPFLFFALFGVWGSSMGGRPHHSGPRRF